MRGKNLQFTMTRLFPKSHFCSKQIAPCLNFLIFRMNSLLVVRDEVATLHYRSNKILSMNEEYVFF